MKDIHGGDRAGFLIKHGREPLDFSMNISPLGLPEAAAEAARKAVGEPAGYPDPHSRRLRKKLAEYHQVPADRIVCGCGAADLIWRIVQVRKPEKALLAVPTFTEYRRALEAWGCPILTWKLPGLEQIRGQDGQGQPAEANPDITEEFLGLLQPDLDMVFLCEPNNPTGRLTDPALLRKIADRCRETGTLLVLDECFMEFVAEPQEHTLIPCTGENSSLVILRAFTKTYAMAALRLGYALCGSRELAESIREAGQPWPVSSVAEAAGIAALEETEYRETLRKQTAEERRILEEELRGCGFAVIPGEANFLLFHTETVDLHKRLWDEGLMIRDCSQMEGLGAGWFRVAVRGGEDNRKLMQSIRHVLEMRAG